ncbi:MAG: AraC family transcriptional regulator [Eubacteriaceae bacterium]|nr:AraC family transcriptional regulator [Eubacteriaceae bacterium]
MQKQGIADIAYGCGFGSHKSFTKSFKSAFGITPEAHRASLGDS